ncbi:MAG: hypothetical protein C0609_01300 [Deltaproteobacteria bacterium]|nr:MAG: hypothetical protein C0609_01300 [Deltaproteobacteria bacterium]
MSVPGGGEAFLTDEGTLRVEWGPVSLVAVAEWNGEHRPNELLKAGDFCLGVLSEVGRDAAILKQDVKRIKIIGGLSPHSARMVEVAKLFPAGFITPMIAVAGTVAEAVAKKLASLGADRVLVSNGGDVALILPKGGEAKVGLVAAVGDSKPSLAVRVKEADLVGGVATSGLGGRSFTLGIADAVTVFSRRAPVADAAATLIANEVNVESAAILRAPASSIEAGSDLGEMPVTKSVGDLTEGEISGALERGARYARGLMDSGLILGALLTLRGKRRIVGYPGFNGVYGL